MDQSQAYSPCLYIRHSSSPNSFCVLTRPTVGIFLPLLRVKVVGRDMVAVVCTSNSLVIEGRRKRCRPVLTSLYNERDTSVEYGGESCYFFSSASSSAFNTLQRLALHAVCFVGLAVGPCSLESALSAIAIALLPVPPSSTGTLPVHKTCGW